MLTDPDTYSAGKERAFDPDDSHTSRQTNT